MVLPFYGAPWQKTCLRPAPCTQTPQSNGTDPENTYAQTAPKNGPCSGPLCSPSKGFTKVQRCSSQVHDHMHGNANATRGSGTAIIRCSGSSSHSRELPGHGMHGRDTRQGWAPALVLGSTCGAVQHLKLGNFD